MSGYTRFELPQSDGVHGSQVLIYDADDLQYWTQQAAATGHVLKFSARVSEDFFGWHDLAHDIYQILPAELIIEVRNT